MKINPAKQIFDFFPGPWKITRNIVSNINSECFQANGYAVFIISKDNTNIIFYSEKVILTNEYINFPATIATQKYQYRYSNSTSTLSKYFSNGDLFYQINSLNNGEYLCNSDKYFSEYIFGDNSFILTYTVQGPSKNYNIITSYSKIINDNALTIVNSVEFDVRREELEPIDNRRVTIAPNLNQLSI